MSAVTTTGYAKALADTSQRHRGITANGTHWIVWADATGLHAAYSLDGTTWVGHADITTWTSGGHEASCSMRVGADDKIHIVYKRSSDGSIYFTRGIPLNSQRTDYSWLAPSDDVKLANGASFECWSPDLAVFQAGSRWAVVITAVVNHQVKKVVHTMTLSGAISTPWYVSLHPGSAAVSDFYPNFGSQLRPSVAFRHTGDGKTPFNRPDYMIVWNVPAAAPGPGVYRRHYRNYATLSWAVASQVRMTAEAAHNDLVRVDFSGDRWIVGLVPGYNTDIVRLIDFDMGVSSWQNLESPDLGVGTVKALAVVPLYDGAVRVFAVEDSTSDLKWIEWNRAAGTWGSWSTLLTGTVQIHSLNARPGYVPSRADLALLDGAGSPYTIRAESQIVNRPPTTPAWLVNSGPADVGSADELSWDALDPDGQPLQAYRLKRSINGGATEYWNATTQAWVSGEHWVATPNGFVSLPVGWGFAGDTVEYRVAVRDQNMTESGDSAALERYGSVKSNPVIVSPAQGSVIDTARIEFTWTVGDQEAYRFRLIRGGAVVVPWAWLAEADRRTRAFIGLLNNIDYTIELQARNADGLESDVEVLNFSTLYPKPPRPIPGVFFDAEQGAIEVMCVNPEPQGLNQPDVEHNTLLRAVGKAPGVDADPADAVEVATGLPPNFSYTDRVVRSGHRHIHIIVGYGPNGEQSSSEEDHINYLTRHQSNLETTILGTTGFEAGDNTTLDLSSDNPVEGGTSLEVSTVAAGSFEYRTVAKPVPYPADVDALVTLRDAGVHIEGRVGVEAYDESGNLIGDPVFLDWTEQEDRVVGPPPTPDVLSLRWSPSPTRSNPLPLPDLLAGQVAIFLYNETQQKVEDTDGWGVMTQLDGQNQLPSPDALAPYDLKGGSPSSAVMLNADSLPGGSHPVRFTFDRGLGPEALDTTFTKIDSTTPRVRYGFLRNAYTNGDSVDLDGKELNSLSAWFFADVNAMTASARALIDYIDLEVVSPTPDTWWSEQGPVYGDTTSAITLPDLTTFTVRLKVVQTDGIEYYGPPATFSTKLPVVGGGGFWGDWLAKIGVGQAKVGNPAIGERGVGHNLADVPELTFNSYATFRSAIETAKSQNGGKLRWNGTPDAKVTWDLDSTVRFARNRNIFVTGEGADITLTSSLSDSMLEIHDGTDNFAWDAFHMYGPTGGENDTIQISSSGQSTPSGQTPGHTHGFVIGRLDLTNGGYEPADERIAWTEPVPGMPGYGTFVGILTRNNDKSWLISMDAGGGVNTNQCQLIRLQGVGLVFMDNEQSEGDRNPKFKGVFAHLDHYYVHNCLRATQIMDGNVGDNAASHLTFDNGWYDNLQGLSNRAGIYASGPDVGDSSIYDMKLLITSRVWFDVPGNAINGVPNSARQNTAGIWTPPKQKLWPDATTKTQVRDRCLAFAGKWEGQ